MASMSDLIGRKRDGHALSEAEIEAFVRGVSDSSIPHEQIGAMLMALYLKGMSKAETVGLTKAMIQSGETLSWPASFQGSIVDKHSTGGVGDKVSLPLAPALAACGMRVPMISGRGLGHTGGTLDKLESIPGLSVEHSPARMREILEAVGCCIVGQTATLVPADRVLYAVRDVTATVGSTPLITGSIVSKKVAEGLNHLILDVKVGRAAFMKTEEDARELARSMVDAGNGAGVQTRAVLTQMDQPIGLMIGNALEVVESVQCLQGKGPADLVELVTVEGGHLLCEAGAAATLEEGVAKIRASLEDGSALAKFEAMIVAQGVAPDVAAAVCSDPAAALQRAAQTTPVPALASGYVADIDAMALAILAGNLGAGRKVRTDVIKFEVGVELCCAVGTHVEAGAPVMQVHHTAERALSEAELEALQHAVTIQAAKVEARSRILDLIV